MSNTAAAASPVVVEKSSGGMVKAVIAGVVLVGGYFAVKSWLAKREQKKTEGQLQDNKSIQYATLLRNALDKWFSADIETIYSVAPKILDFKAVADAYNTLYSRILTEDLTKRLEPEELKKFYTLMQVKGRPQTEYTYIDRNVNAPLKRGMKVGINWNGKTSINTYRNTEDYPLKPYFKLNKPPTVSNKAFATVLQVDKVNYKDSTVSMLLAWVQLPSGQKFWVRLVDLKK
jgi:hypothetical protein